MSRMAMAIQEEVEKMRARKWGTKRRKTMPDEEVEQGSEIAPEPETDGSTAAASTQTETETAGAEGETQMAKATRKSARKTAKKATRKTAAPKAVKAKKAAKANGTANGRAKTWDPNKLPKAKDLTLVDVDGKGNQYLNFRFGDGTVVRAGLQGLGRKATAAKARDIVVEVLKSQARL